MRKGALALSAAIIICAFGGAFERVAVAGAQSAPAASPVSFNREILPILANNCFACHGPDEKKRETKFHFDTQEGMFLKRGVIEPGNASDSLLIEKITDPNPKDRMPPPDSGHSLTPRQIELLRRWIDEGAKWDTHWAYVAPKRPDLPVVRQASWVRNPIDQFVLARLEREGSDAVTGGRQGDAASASDVRPHRAAANACRDRRVSCRSGHPTRTRSRSIGCFGRPTMASGWRCPGSTPRVTRIRTATTSTAFVPCGHGATG